MAKNTKVPGPRWIKTAQNRTAAVMIMAGIAAIGLFIAALAGGFEGWVWIAAAAAVILVGGGVFSLRAGARRPVEPQPVVYRPDSTDVAFDVDVDTGRRTPHKE
ncbi:MAG: hypothetical protein WBQ44_19685 [Rhodococcus sp. (in: high G+C Gram-positive bacteria)]